MFDWLLRSKKALPNDEWEARLVWLPPGHPQNPFEEEVLDCRSVALSFLSTTENKRVADSFSRLRNSDGRDSLGKLPDNAMISDCSLRFPFNGEHTEGCLHRARQMEDKWDFFVYASKLYIRMSWTGVLQHVAELVYETDAVVIRQIYSEPNVVFKDSSYAVARVHFLVTTHLGNGLIPFPIPPDFPREARKVIALVGFGDYGRMAQFASYRAVDCSTLNQLVK